MNTSAKRDICISVIVCVHNEDKTLNKCIKSLFEQSFEKTKYEIIVVDDDSSDGTSRIAQNWVVRTENSSTNFTYAKIEHGGLSVARNTGILLAIGKNVAFMDGDAVADKDWVQNLAIRFRSTNDPLILGGKVSLLNPESAFAKKIYNSFFTYNMKNKNVAIGTNMAFTKSLFSDNYPFHPLFLRRGDETFLFKKLEKTAAPVREPLAEVFHECPESLKEWLKSKYDNGYFGAQVDLVFGDITGLLKMAVYRVQFLIMPVLITIFIPFNYTIGLYFSCIVYLILIINRYIRNKTLLKLHTHYLNNKETTSKLRIWEFFELTFYCLLGDIYNDYGYCHRLIKYMISFDSFKGKERKDATITILKKNFLS